MSQGDQDLDLDEVRHAAFELRQRDPSEAVKVLRRLIRKGGDIEPLAHGALAEILLEEFADYDGAIHHYQKLLQLVPRIAAGALGLARAHARNGEQQPAQDAYALAVTELESLANAARAGKSGDDVAGADEAILTALETAVEERELCRDQGMGKPQSKVSADLLLWAEDSCLFDDPEEPEDIDDWIRFAQLRGLLFTLTGTWRRGWGTSSGLVRSSRQASGRRCGRCSTRRRRICRTRPRMRSPACALRICRWIRMRRSGVPRYWQR